MRIVEYSENHADQLAALNRRLHDGGCELQFVPELESATEGPVVRRSFVALDPKGEVHGAYTVIRQPHLICGRPETVSFLQLPLSEGLVDSRFSIVGALLIRDFTERERLCFGLGMGGLDRPLPQLLVRMGFRATSVPFFFFVCRTGAFLRNITYLRRSRLARVGSRVMAATGLAAPPIHLTHAWLGRNRPSIRGLTVEEQQGFGAWCDDLWQKVRSYHSLIAIRDKEVLQNLYRADDARLHRLLVTDRREAVGWALVGDSAMRGHAYFGDMRLGSIIDCLAIKNRRGEVIRAATDYLRDRGVDLIVTNQQEADWCDALRRNGYLPGPSNFILATSPALTRAVSEADPEFARAHLNRGDGDGPYNL